MQFDTAIGNLSSNKDIMHTAIAEDAAKQNLISICEHYKDPSRGTTEELKIALSDYVQRVDRCIEQLAYVKDDKGLVGFVRGVLEQRRALALNMYLNGLDSYPVRAMELNILQNATNERTVKYQRRLNDILAPVDASYAKRAALYERFLASQLDIQKSCLYQEGVRLVNESAGHE